MDKFGVIVDKRQGIAQLRDTDCGFNLMQFIVSQDKRDVGNVFHPAQQICQAGLQWFRPKSQRVFGLAQRKGNLQDIRVSQLEQLDGQRTGSVSFVVLSLVLPQRLIPVS